MSSIRNGLSAANEKRTFSTHEHIAIVVLSQAVRCRTRKCKSFVESFTHKAFYAKWKFHEYLSCDLNVCFQPNEHHVGIANDDGKKEWIVTTDKLFSCVSANVFLLARSTNARRTFNGPKLSARYGGNVVIRPSRFARLDKLLASLPSLARGLFFRSICKVHKNWKAVNCN